MSLFKKKDPTPETVREPAPAAPPAPAAETKTPLDPAVLQGAVAEAQRRHLALGQIVALLANTPQFQGATLASVMALVAPAIATGQFVIAMAQSAQTGAVAPLGVGIWASVSDEVDQRMSQDLEKPFSISSNEWQSGPHAWVIVTAGDQRAVLSMLANAQKTTLKGRVLKMRVTGEDGKPAVKMFVGEAS